MKAAACSWRTVMSLIFFDCPRESVIARVSSPGTWKTNSTSSFPRHRANKSDPFIELGASRPMPNDDIFRGISFESFRERLSCRIAFGPCPTAHTSGRDGQHLPSRKRTVLHHRDLAYKMRKSFGPRGLQSLEAVH